MTEKTPHVRYRLAEPGGTAVAGAGAIAETLGTRYSHEGAQIGQTIFTVVAPYRTSQNVCCSPRDRTFGALQGCATTRFMEWEGQSLTKVDAVKRV